MSSKSTEPRSISSQLVILFTLAAALLLSCGLGIFYGMVLRHAFEEDNAILADKVFAIRAELQKPGGPAALQSVLSIQRPGEQAVYWVRVLNSAGEILVESPGMRKLLQPDVFPAPRPGADAARPQSSHQAGKLFYLVAVTEAAGDQNFVIQVAQDRSADEELTRKFGALLAIVLALGILAAAMIATGLTKRGLRPLAKMTESLRRVGPAHLNERLGATAWPAELQPMAAAFDEMFNRLESSFTRLSQFSADLAHELRTPVANIRGEAEVSLTRERSPAEYREVMESCVAECARLSGIIDNLLFLARAESADQQVQRTTFDGRAAIEKIAAYYRPLCEERHVTLSCEGSGEISADAVLFGRALSNLVENALRFTPAGGAITLSLQNRESVSEVSVRDTGTGISPEHLPRVFDRFYRADASRSSAGTGLGLALVRSIAVLHGGSATARSEPNQGTTVTLTFPRAAGSTKEFAEKSRALPTAV